MAKSATKRRNPSKRSATTAFKRAWKLLGKLERQLTAARAEETKRRRQLVLAGGPDIARRQKQLEAATARAETTMGLLTELSDMIAANAHPQGSQVVSDVAHEAAQAIRAEEQAKAATETRRTGPRRTVPRRRAAPATSAQLVEPKPEPEPRAMATTDTEAASMPATPIAKRAATPTRRRSPGDPASTPTFGRPAAPRPRRSLQPGKPDPGPSTS